MYLAVLVLYNPHFVFVPLYVLYSIIHLKTRDVQVDVVIQGSQDSDVLWSCTFGRKDENQKEAG